MIDHQAIQWPRQAPARPAMASHARTSSEILAVVIAIVMALPAIGMIAGGFMAGKLWLGWFGVALFVAFIVGYFVAARFVLTYSD
jgi:hypothetical protein